MSIETRTYEVWPSDWGRSEAETCEGSSGLDALQSHIKGEDIDLHYGSGGSRYKVAEEGSPLVEVYDVWTTVEPFDETEEFFVPVIDKIKFIRTEEGEPDGDP